MKSIATRIGIGITLYLSFGMMGTNSSLALSLKFSDRYELTNSNLEKNTLIAEQLLLEPIIIDDALSLTEPLSPQIVRTPNNESSDFQISSFSARHFRELFSNLSIETEAEFASDFAEIIETQEIENEHQSAFNYTTTDFLDWQSSDLQIQIGTAESEENLLSYISNALGSLDFSAAGSNSSGSPNVAILPQVAYEDIFLGLYDFDIDVTANPNPTAPDVANSSIPENFLVTREFASNYNLPGYVSPAGYDSTISNVLGTVPNDAELLLDTFLQGSRQNSSSADYTEDLTERVRVTLTEVINVPSSAEEIEVQPFVQKVPTASDLYRRTKDPMLQALEEQFVEQQENIERKRQALQKKLELQRQQREKKRQQLAINEKRKREARLRKQRLQQTSNFRKQQNRLNRNQL